MARRRAARLQASRRISDSRRTLQYSSIRDDPAAIYAQLSDRMGEIAPR